MDDAYQVTFADVLSASAKAEQILLVGDPGQIGPVTTSNPAMWQGRPGRPLRAPEGVQSPGDAASLHLAAVADRAHTFHNAQASVIQALLRGRDVDGIAVGSADSLPGGQWAAVVALDRLTAPRAASHAPRGWLCVMASRHYAT